MAKLMDEDPETPGEGDGGFEGPFVSNVIVKSETVINSIEDWMGYAKGKLREEGTDPTAMTHDEILAAYPYEPSGR